MRSLSELQELNCRVADHYGYEAKSNQLVEELHIQEADLLAIRDKKMSRTLERMNK